MIARHLLGVLGVIAASVLLAVSAAMNYRFGFSLGKTAWDGQIYGAASAAADCFKALVPFFFFAAWRNRMWSQAFAAALVWVVVTGYSMTSAVGHAALNRLDTSGQRMVATANYKDLRADSKRAEDQLSWIPAHRPAETVAAELNVVKAQRFWLLTKECTDVNGKAAREYCQQYHRLSAELASGQQATKLEARIAEIGAKLAKAANGGTNVLAEADPQAAVFSKLTGIELEQVQTGLALFVALLIEIGSAFGMYVAFAYWRMHGPMPAEARATNEAQATGTALVAEPMAETAVVTAAAQPPSEARLGANDNKLLVRPTLMPESDVELFYKEAVLRAQDDDSISSQELYDGYRHWSRSKDKRPLNMPRFTVEFENLGYTTIEMGGRKRYFGIALAPELLATVSEKRAHRKRRNAGLEQEAATEEARAA
jgi:hypothetical protein